jgi:anthranilate phosphoribosyltransferase
LSAAEAEAVFEQVMQGRCSDVQIAALLTGLRVKGETVDELLGAVRALRRHAAPVETGRDDVLDTCGTGGDGSGTFNVSTAAALVAAAAGAVVAKHGNRGVSSASGSSQVLEALGVRVDVGGEVVRRSIAELGFGFCFAPRFHGAMRYAAPVRRELRFRTIFNLAGPLANPARPGFQLVGVGRVELAEIMAAALERLGTRRAFVVCGAEGVDEVALWGTTTVLDVQPGSIRRLQWTPDDFGLAACESERLRVHSPEESARVIRAILAGQRGPHRDVVLANAAAALWVAGMAEGLLDGVRRAAEAIDQQRAAGLLDRLIALTNEAV